MLAYKSGRWCSLKRVRVGSAENFRTFQLPHEVCVCGWKFRGKWNLKHADLITVNKRLIQFCNNWPPLLSAVRIQHRTQFTIAHIKGLRVENSVFCLGIYISNFHTASVCCVSSVEELKSWTICNEICLNCQMRMAFNLELWENIFFPIRNSIPSLNLVCN